MGFMEGVGKINRLQHISNPATLVASKPGFQASPGGKAAGVVQGAMTGGAGGALAASPGPAGQAGGMYNMSQSFGKKPGLPQGDMSQTAMDRRYQDQQVAEGIEALNDPSVDNGMRMQAAPVLGSYQFSSRRRF